MPSKTKNIKVSEEIHGIIGQLGSTKTDYGDVVETAIRHYINCPKVKGDKTSL